MEPMKKVTFTKEMKQTHTILIPTMLPIHFKILGNVLEIMDTKLKFWIILDRESLIRD